jgi:hypothetical protein
VKVITAERKDLTRAAGGAWNGHQWVDIYLSSCSSVGVSSHVRLRHATKNPGSTRGSCWMAESVVT